MLDDTFLVVQSDVISENPLGDMRRFHTDRGGEVSRALTTVEDPSAYGVAILDREDVIVRFVEKPHRNRSEQLGKHGLLHPRARSRTLH